MMTVIVPGGGVCRDSSGESPTGEAGELPSPVVL